MSLVRNFRWKKENDNLIIDVYNTPQYIIDKDNNWIDIDEEYSDIIDLDFRSMKRRKRRVADLKEEIEDTKEIIEIAEEDGLDDKLNTEKELLSELEEELNSIDFSEEEEYQLKRIYELKDIRDYFVQSKARGQIVLEINNADLSVDEILEKIEVSGRDENISRVEKDNGIEYPMHFVWLDNAEDIPGIVKMPSPIYSKIYHARGLKQSPELDYIPKYKEGMERPFYKIVDGETHIYVNGFSGVGTEQEPIEITRRNDFSNIGSGDDGWTNDAYYVISQDIDFYNSYRICNVRFQGVIDGQGNKLKNLYRNNDNFYLFEEIGSRGIIKDLIIDDFSTGTYNSYIAPIANNNYGTITNCHIRNTEVRYPRGRVGGIAINNYNTISSCSVDFYSEYNDGYYVGGIAAQNYESGIIIDCKTNYTLDRFRSNSCYFYGGIAGRSYGNIIDCNSTLDIYYSSDRTRFYYFGGIAGRTYSTSLVLNSHASFDRYYVRRLDNGYYHGGLVGYSSGSTFLNNSVYYDNYYNDNGNNTSYSHYYHGGFVGYSNSNSYYENCYVVVDPNNITYRDHSRQRYDGSFGYVNNAGSIFKNCYVSFDMKGGNKSPFISSSSNTEDYTLINCYYNNSFESLLAPQDVEIGLSEDEMKHSGSFQNFEFVKFGSEYAPWTMTNNNNFGYPILQHDMEYEISTYEQLMNIGTGRYGYGLLSDYTLTDDIQFPHRGFDIRTIGSEDKPFLGSLDGLNHYIDNIYMDKRNDDNIGLFGVIGTFQQYINILNENIAEKDIVTNLVLSNDYISNYSPSVKNLTIKNSYIRGKEKVGIVAGRNRSAIENVIVLNSTCRGQASTGGFVGENNGTIKNSLSKNGEVINILNNAGGFVGYNRYGEIQNCYARNKINGYDATGGFCGNSLIDTIKNSYASGEVNGNRNTRGFIGRIQNIDGSTFENNFYNNTINEFEHEDETTGAYAKTAHELTQIDTYSEWGVITPNNPGAPWSISSENNDGYPELQHNTSFDIDSLDKFHAMGKGYNMYGLHSDYNITTNIDLQEKISEEGIEIIHNNKENTLNQLRQENKLGLNIFYDDFYLYDSSGTDAGSFNDVNTWTNFVSYTDWTTYSNQVRSRVRDGALEMYTRNSNVHVQTPIISEGTDNVSFEYKIGSISRDPSGGHDGTAFMFSSGDKQNPKEIGTLKIDWDSFETANIKWGKASKGSHTTDMMADVYSVLENSYNFKEFVKFELNFYFETDEVEILVDGVSYGRLDFVESLDEITFINIGQESSNAINHIATSYIKSDAGIFSASKEGVEFEPKVKSPLFESSSMFVNQHVLDFVNTDKKEVYIKENSGLPGNDTVSLAGNLDSFYNGPIDQIIEEIESIKEVQGIYSFSITNKFVDGDTLEVDNFVIDFKDDGVINEGNEVINTTEVTSIEQQSLQIASIIDNQISNYTAEFSNDEIIITETEPFDGTDLDEPIVTGQGSLSGWSIDQASVAEQLGKWRIEVDEEGFVFNGIFSIQRGNNKKDIVFGDAEYCDINTNLSDEDQIIALKDIIENEFSNVSVSISGYTITISEDTGQTQEEAFMIVLNKIYQNSKSIEETQEQLGEWSFELGTENFVENDQITINTTKELIDFEFNTNDISYSDALAFLNNDTPYIGDDFELKSQKSIVLASWGNRNNSFGNDDQYTATFTLKYNLTGIDKFYYNMARIDETSNRQELRITKEKLNLPSEPQVSGPGAGYVDVSDYSGIHYITFSGYTTSTSSNAYGGLEVVDFAFIDKNQQIALQLDDIFEYDKFANERTYTFTENPSSGSDVKIGETIKDTAINLSESIQDTFYGISVTTDNVNDNKIIIKEKQGSSSGRTFELLEQNQYSKIKDGLINEITKSVKYSPGSFGKWSFKIKDEGFKEGDKFSIITQDQTFEVSVGVTEQDHINPNDGVNKQIYDLTQVLNDNLIDFKTYYSDYEIDIDYSTDRIFIKCDLDLYQDLTLLEFENKINSVLNNTHHNRIFTPIGSRGLFTGNINGNNNIIKNIIISNFDDSYLGIFKRMANNKVENINLVNVYVSGKDYIGILSGYANTHINNVNIQGKLIGNKYVGGMFGYYESRDKYRTLKHIDGFVRQQEDDLYSYYSGGLNYVTINNSSIDVRLDALDYYVGGVIGYVFNTNLFNLNVNSKLVGDRYIGGVFGFGINVNTENLDITTEIMDNDFIYSKHSHRYYQGGIAGYNRSYEPYVNTMYSKNTTVDAKIDGYSYMGGLYGYYLNGNIENSEVDADLFGRRYAGGIAGRTHTDTFIKESDVSVKIELDYLGWSSYDAGGIVGYAYDTTIEGSRVNINKDDELYYINCSKDYSGGIVGRFGVTDLQETNHSIIDSKVETKIFAEEYAGGVVGSFEGKDIKENNLDVTVNGSKFIGGIVGEFQGNDILDTNIECNVTLIDKTSEEIEDQYTSAVAGKFEGNNIENTILNANVEGHEYTGGIVGQFIGNDIINSEINLELSGHDYSAGVVGDFDGKNIEESNLNYTINGHEHVGGIAGYFNGSDVLTSHIIGTLSSTQRYAGGMFGRFSANKIKDTYIEINLNSTGHSVGGIAGRSDGNTELSNLDIVFDVETNSNYSGGIFGYCTGTSVKDVRGTGSVKGSQYTAGLAGYSSIDDIEFVDLRSIDINGDDDTGGLIGYQHTGNQILVAEIKGGNIEGLTHTGGLIGRTNTSPDNVGSILDSSTHCYVKGGNYTGGVAGLSYNNIKRSSAIINVQGGDYTGGFVGRIVNSSIENSYSRGEIGGELYVGGFVGQDSTNAPNISKSHSSSVILYSTQVANTGAFIGDSQSSSGNNNYYDIDYSNRNDNESKTGAIGLTEDQMMEVASFEEWDFADVWIMGHYFPMLQGLAVSAYIEFPQKAIKAVDDPIMAGGSSIAWPLKVGNKFTNHLPIGHIKVEKEELPEYVDIRFSKTLENFEDVEVLELDDVLYPDESMDIFFKIYTDKRISLAKDQEAIVKMQAYKLHH